MKHRPELDGVRGIACLLVLALHCCVGLIPGSPGSAWHTVQFRLEPFMSGGVDLFFVLSGFLICGNLMDSRERPAYFRRFWTRRFARIFPVYYLTIGSCALVMFVQRMYPTILGAKLDNPAMVFWPFLIFLQNIYFAITENTGSSMVGVTWSLAIEEQFYVIMPALLFLLPRRVITVCALIIVLATPFARSYVVLTTGVWKAGYLMTFDRMDALSLGILLAVVARSIAALSMARRVQTLVNLIALALVALQAFGFWGWVSEPMQHRAGTYYISLVLLCVQYPLLNIAMAGLMLNLITCSDGWAHRALRNPILTRAGLVSYAAYMYHQTFNWGAFALLDGTNPRLSNWGQAFMPVLVLGVTFVASAASYRWFEMPIRRWAHAVSKGYGRAPALAEGAVG